MCKISIIVPVYNVEKYLRECLDSILAQTFTEWECILVDDGSPDNCGKICDEYAEKDARFRVIHQENGGSVAARIAGLALVEGDYITFVDSDDWVDANMLASFIDKAIETDADIVSSDVFIEMKEETKYCAIHFDDDASIILRRLLSGEIPGWSWSKLYRTSFWKENKIQAKIGADVMEDVFQTTQLLLANPKIAHINKGFYHYNRTNPTSYCASINDRFIVQSAQNIKLVAEFLQQKGVYGKYEKDFVRMLLRWKVQILRQDASYAQHFMNEYNRKILLYPFKNVVLRIFYAIILSTGTMGICIWRFYKKVH